MNRAWTALFPDTTDTDARAKIVLTAIVTLLLPLQMLFPAISGWVAGILTLAGFVWLCRHRKVNAMDWHFAAVCLILPLAQLWNMFVMGWAPDFLYRPTHLIWALMIYLLIGHYGVHRNALFYSACGAALAALGIAVFEALYLGHDRVFGLGNRWNAVPFGNYSMLFAFFCLCGAFVSPGAANRRARMVLGVTGFVCGFAASALSGSRGGWLAIPFLIVLCFFFNDRLSRRSRMVALAVSIVAVLAVFAGSERMRDRIDLATEQVSSYLAHPLDVTAQSTSTGLRLSMWQWGIGKFRQHPYTGIGLAAYERQRQEAVAEGAVPPAFLGFANLHNEFITSLALGGLPAAAALIAFWVIGWRFFFSRLHGADDDQHYFALCGLVAVMGTGLFSMTESLFGTSSGTKAIMLAFALPAGALRYLYTAKERIQ